MWPTAFFNNSWIYAFTSFLKTPNFSSILCFCWFVCQSRNIQSCHSLCLQYSTRSRYLPYSCAHPHIFLRQVNHNYLRLLLPCGKSFNLPRDQVGLFTNWTNWRRFFLIFLQAGGFYHSLVNCICGVGLSFVCQIFNHSYSEVSAIHRGPCCDAICIFSGKEKSCILPVCVPWFFSL